MVELTPEQHQAIAATGAQPVRAIDPVTQTEYVLLRAEIYDRIKGGDSLYAIHHDLNDRGIRTPGGGKRWDSSAVRSITAANPPSAAATQPIAVADRDVLAHLPMNWFGTLAGIDALLAVAIVRRHRHSRNTSSGR